MTVRTRAGYDVPASCEVFGDIAVFTGTTYPGTVVALEDVDVWSSPRKPSLISSTLSVFAMAVIRHLGERVLQYISLVEDLSLRSVEAGLQTRCCGMRNSTTGN